MIDDPPLLVGAVHVTARLPPPLVATTDEPLAVGGVVAGLTTFVALGAQGAVAVTPTMIGGSLFSRIDLAGSGLPITVERVEDVGRRRIVRARLEGAELVIAVPEDAEVPADARVEFQTGKVGVFADSWRLGSAP